MNIVSYEFFLKKIIYEQRCFDFGKTRKKYGERVIFLNNKRFHPFKNMFNKTGERKICRW